MKKMLSFSLCFIMLFSSCSKKETADEIDYTTINSSWECDYLKIGVNSNWNITENINGNYISVTWDRNGASPIFCHFSYGEFFKKYTQNELIQKWKSDEHSEDASFDTFVKNGQAYIITKDSSQFEGIEFHSDKLWGTFTFYSDYEDYVLKMIDSIVFY